MESVDGASLQTAVVESFSADPDIDFRAMKGLRVATTKQLGKSGLSESQKLSQ